MKRSEKYALPLKKRAEIENYFLNQDGEFLHRTPGDGREYYLFCFNVKLGTTLDCSFDNLLKIKQREEGNGKDSLFSNPIVIGACRQKYIQKFGDDKMSKGGGDWYETVEELARNMFLQQDQTLRNGGSRLDVVLGFHGRSNGWLCIEKFEGVQMDSEEALKGLDFHQLRRLYELVVMLAADLGQGRGAEDAVEYQAMDHFFQYECNDLIEKFEDWLAYAPVTA